MKISVIIPVYKAEKYVQKAVESALRQKECQEVVLVEDGSPDDSLNICNQLSQKYENVCLYQHENNMNKGAGESRNLGVLKAKYDWIAFLDADDIYLPDRFTSTKKLLDRYPGSDGVYEPVKSSFKDDASSKRYYQVFSSEITMIKRKTEPHNLFESLIAGNNGHIHLDGLLLRKEAIIAVGMFPELRLHQDTGLIFKLSLLCTLIHGGEDNRPIAERFIHNDNRITDCDNDFLNTRYLLFEDLLSWMEKHKSLISKKRIDLVKARYYLLKYKILKGKKDYINSIFNYAIYKLFFEKKLQAVIKII